jgi:anti-sigma regulatory factor (Ser/Thr protein kinase)
VVAVNEIASNAIIHGGGGGLFTIVHARDGVHVEVSDHGTGFAGPLTPTRNGHRQPPDALSGRGLWLAECLCPDIGLTSSPSGVTVRIFAPQT